MTQKKHIYKTQTKTHGEENGETQTNNRKQDTLKTDKQKQPTHGTNQPNTNTTQHKTHFGQTHEDNNTWVKSPAGQKQQATQSNKFKTKDKSHFNQISKNDNTCGNTAKHRHTVQTKHT